MKHTTFWRSIMVVATLTVGLLVSIFWPLSEDKLSNGSVVSLRITDRSGNLLREVRPDGRGRPVSLDEINRIALEALVATEDRHFYRHPGVDPVALVRASIDNLKSGKVISGGSTITMQVARTLREKQNRGFLDKLSEMHLALRLEAHLSKKKILALWLNRVSFGNRAHGIEAASQLYFGKGARDLTTSESAFLIGLPQSPSRYNPYRFPDRAQARYARVLTAMARSRVITEPQRQQFESMRVTVFRNYPAFRAPHLTDHLIASLPDDKNRPAEIRTTLNGTLQTEVEALLKSHIARLRTLGASQAAAVVLDNESGEVLAYVGSVDFWDTHTGGQNDGVQMLRQPGSALKPFTYAHALASRRYTPATILADLEIQVLEAGGAFSPDNYDKQYHGPVPVRQALACSYNVPAVRLAREFGAPALLRTFRQAGLTSLSRSPDFYGVGLTLGNGEVRLLELARAYAGLARSGSLPALRMERWRVTAEGDTLAPSYQSPVPSGLTPEVTYLLTSILSDPEARAPAFGRGGPLELPFPCAVKSGTSKDYRDNWTVGYTSRHTVAVWAGNFDGSPMQWISGVSGAGPLLQAIFLELGSGGEFHRPTAIEEFPVCPASGARPSKYCPGSKLELFLKGTAPRDTCTVHRIVRFDRRTGQLADQHTPKREIEERIYVVYPPEYHSWMRARGLPFPPSIRQEIEANGTSDLLYSDDLSIQFPENGTNFQIDPVLRRNYQRIQLKGSAGETIRRVSWWVNDLAISGDYNSVSWRLEPGTHRIELRGIDSQGRPLRSRPSIIQVKGIE